MRLLPTLDRWLHPVHLTRGRMAVALIVAVAADALQVLLTTTPFASQAIDVLAAVLVMVAVGFHVLLLPTFIIELVPFVNDLPTWTGCVLAVIALRRREERARVK
ncbi:MAG: hypothetical protein EXR27_16540 [Betaproteobacteria bacterium]|nr:hypothetical protein [Betaproteobacteria bacterium]